MFQRMNEIMLRYSYDKAEYIGVGYFGNDDPKATDNLRAMPKKWYQDYMELDFEDIKCKAPKGYDGVLKKWYGNYMKLPPKEEQKPHGTFEVYRISGQGRTKLWQ